MKHLLSPLILKVGLMCLLSGCNPNSNVQSATNESHSYDTETETSQVGENPSGPIVCVTKQLYSYDEMLEDLEILQQKYPQCVKYELKAETYQGRQIPLVTFGNANAKRHVMVMSAIHAREYMSAQLVMSMLEHYASNYDNGKYKETTLKNIFDNVCFIIVPMANPDGVEIAQKGEKGALTADVKQWVRQNTKEGTKYDQIKSNARGVDLNRNFRNGFGKDRRYKPTKNYSHHPGPEPYSEIESVFLLEVSQMHDYALFLNYHTSGNLVYYGCKNAQQSVNNAALKLSNIIKRHTGFPLYGPDTSPACGSWADEVEVLYKRPSATIELGSKNPVPISEFNGLYKKNLWIWADIALAVMNSQF